MQMLQSSSVAHSASDQKMAASGEFGDTNQSDSDMVSNQSDESVNDGDAGKCRMDRISVRCKRDGGDLRKYPIVRDLVRMRCMFIGPLGERYYAIGASFRRYTDNYLSGFNDAECRPYFVHQPCASRTRQQRDQQFPEVGTVVEVVRATNDDQMRRCYLEGLDVRPMRPSGLAILRFLDTRWQPRCDQQQ